MTHQEQCDIVECSGCGGVYRWRSDLEACRNCGHQLSRAEDQIDLDGEVRVMKLGPATKIVLAMFRRYMQSRPELSDTLSDDPKRRLAALKKANLLNYAGRPGLDEHFTGPTICGWCRRQYQSRPASSNCETCGGTLPMPADGDPGPPPDAPPRKLPKQFLYDLYVTQNKGNVVFGVSIILFFAALFYFIPVIEFRLFSLLCIWLGGYIVCSNCLKCFQRHIALSRGAARRGRIEGVRVHIDPQDSAGNKSGTVYSVLYRFRDGDDLWLGFKHTRDPGVTEHFVGQPIWVVTVPGHPEYHCNWPPLA